VGVYAARMQARNGASMRPGSDGLPPTLRYIRPPTQQPPRKINAQPRTYENTTKQKALALARAFA